MSKTKTEIQKIYEEIIEELDRKMLKESIEGASLFCAKDFTTNEAKQDARHWHLASSHTYGKSIEIVKKIFEKHNINNITENEV